MATGTVRVRLDASTMENMKLFHEKTNEIDAVTMPGAQRQHHGDKGADRTGAVDHSRLGQLARNALEEGTITQTIKGNPTNICARISDV